MEMKNKTALVTGGGTGIGRAVSLSLANRGAAVVVNYSRSKAEAEETVGMIESQGGRALAVKADVSKISEVQDMFDRAVGEFGTVDLLVNNASITRHIEP